MIALVNRPKLCLFDADAEASKHFVFVLLYIFVIFSDQVMNNGCDLGECD